MIVGYGVGSVITNVVGVSDGEIVGDPVTGASVGEAEGDLVGSAVTTTGAREEEGDAVGPTGDAVTGISAVGDIVVGA